MAKLRPAFRSGEGKEGGTVTAGNASGLNDGAIATIVASQKAVDELNLKPLARIVSSAVVGVEPRITVEPSRVGEVTHYVANIGKARALLGYDPKQPLEEGIRKAVQWSTEWWRAHGGIPG